MSALAHAVSSNRIVVAAAQYPLERLDSFEAWIEKLHRWVWEAVEFGASIAVFPEYASLEVAGIGTCGEIDLMESLSRVIDQGESIDAAYAEISRFSGLPILAGNRPERLEDGRIVNRAKLFCPDGNIGHQDKIVMTRFEREVWGISAGDTLSIIHTPIGPVGIAICYDVEFPMISRRLAEAGARIILTPSATDSMHGYWRVRIGAQARALENQCFVIQAPTVGMSRWLPAMDENFGAAGVFGFSDMGVPADGVVAIGLTGEPQWVVTEINLDLIDLWRENGTVKPYHHWHEQQPPYLVVQNAPGVEVLAHLSEMANNDDRYRDIPENSKVHPRSQVSGAEPTSGERSV